jgi:hypothetical protein
VLPAGATVEMGARERWPMRMLLGESTVQHRRQILDGVPDGSLACQPIT